MLMTDAQLEALKNLSQERDIDIEWLKPNVERGKDQWILTGYKGVKQYKPDNPKVNEDGKKIKYITPKGSTPDLMIPLNPDGKPALLDYSADEWIVITEGFFKAIKACSVNIPTVSVSGVWNGTVKTPIEGVFDVVRLLKECMNSGRTRYIIAFDADCASNPDVWEATKRLANSLAYLGCRIKIATGLWTVEEGKGMDDFISQNGVEAMRAILEKSYTLDEWEQKVKNPSTSKKKTRKTNKPFSHSEAIEKLKQFYQDRIRLNQMTNEIEKDRESYYLENAYIHISQEVGIELTKTAGIDYVVEIARENAYHPVVNYLDGLKNKASYSHLKDSQQNDIESELREKLTRITGVKNELHLTFLVKTLIAAVRRAYQPGCFVKNVCILYGGQNIGKSSFWRELAGIDFFSDSYNGTNEKDELLKLHAAWITEIGEFDRVYKKVDVANLKNIISSPSDLLRPPYGRTTQKMKRRSILVATTNSQEILRDPTGSVRFWVVPIEQKINFTELIDSRDFIWTCAIKLHELGYSHELNSEQELASAENNEIYSGFDLIEEAVKNACRIYPLSDVLLEKIKLQDVFNTIYPDKFGQIPSKNEQRQITDALTKLSYRSKTVKMDGRAVRMWVLENKVTAISEALPIRYLSVTPAVQGFEGEVTVVTADSQTYCNLTNNSPPADALDKVDDFSVTSVTTSENLTPQGLHFGNAEVTADEMSVTPTTVINPGDTVRLVKECNYLPVGKTGIVTEVNHGILTVQVERSNKIKNESKCISVCISADCIEVINRQM